MIGTIRDHEDYETATDRDYVVGDRYDADKAEVIRDRHYKNDAVHTKWLLPLLLIPLLAFGLWGGSRLIQTENSSNASNNTAASSTNTTNTREYNAASGVGGGPVTSVTPTPQDQSTSQTTQPSENSPQAGIGGSGSDTSSPTVPTQPPSTGHGE